MPKSMLPTVEHDTALSAMCDLIRDEIESAPDAEGIITEWVLQIAQENPELLQAVGGSSARRAWRGNGWWLWARWRSRTGFCRRRRKLRR